MTDWKEKTCKECMFRVNDVCRRSPLDRNVVFFTYDFKTTSSCQHPQIKKYDQACAEFKPKEDNNAK